MKWIKLINILCNSLKTTDDIQKFFYSPTTLMFNTEDEPKAESGRE